MQFSLIPTPDNYFTLKSATFGEFKEKASRFLCYAYPVADEQEIHKALEALRKEHYNATHVCYAYRLGTSGLLFRANDDGEPSSTAGKPILGQIDSFGLTNVLVAVVRYYGGTKLGTGGLKAAYKYGAKVALEAGEKIEKLVEELIDIQYPYSEMNSVMKLLRTLDLNIKTHLEYKEVGNESYPCIRVAVRKSLIERFCAGLDKIDGLSYEQLPGV